MLVVLHGIIKADFDRFLSNLVSLRMVANKTAFATGLTGIKILDLKNDDQIKRFEFERTHS